MSDSKEAKKTKPKSEAQLAAEADESERSLARSVGLLIPAVTILVAIGVGLVTSIGPAILVFAAGALLGTITLLWASLRTLGGDAPLPSGLASAAIAQRANRSAEEQKRAVLLALKDLEHERAIGKIDDADYAEVAARYREEAKTLLRQIDEEIAPKRPRAEEIAKAHLRKRGLLGDEGADESNEDDAKEPEEKPEPKPRHSIEPVPPTRKSSEPPPALKNEDDEEKTTAEDRAVCPKCGTSNEQDAAFCKKCGTAMKKAEETAETSEKHAD
ncbi:MAG TPA: zinc ribbon domain-containing protein [Polyangiaceae bacterium]